MREAAREAAREPGRGSGSKYWKRTGRAKTEREGWQLLTAADLCSSAVVGKERRKKEGGRRGQWVWLEQKIKVP